MIPTYFVSANTSASVQQHILWIVPSIVAIGFIVAFTIVCLKMRKKNKASGIIIINFIFRPQK